MIAIFRWYEETHSCLKVSGERLSEELEKLKTTTDPFWIDLQAPTNDEIRLVYEQLQPVHPLTLEDITRQRRDPDERPHLPKVEEFPDYLFVIVNPLLEGDWPEGELTRPLTTQLATIITHTRLITYHEQPVAAIDNLRRYLDRHEEQGRRGPDYLFHLILDAMVDEYAPLLDSLTDRLDELEEAVFQNRAGNPLHQMLHLKRRLTIVRKTLTYEREILARMARGEFELIDEREMVYYRNVYDHLVRFTELTEGSREMVADLLQTHLSVVSNRLNEIMKVLTIFSAVMLPMTLVSSVYGMNFTHMPEIDKPWGYPWALGLMVFVGLVPLAVFRWKRWI